jgi:hypothetical protein
MSSITSFSGARRSLMEFCNKGGDKQWLFLKKLYRLYGKELEVSVSATERLMAIQEGVIKHYHGTTVDVIVVGVHGKLTIV